MLDPMQVAEEELQEAVRSHAREELHRRLAGDFRFAGGSLGQLDKDGWIQAACVIRWKTFTFVDLVSTGDEHVRVVHATLDQEGELAGRDVSGRWLLTDTWVPCENRWVLLARHASPAREQPVDTSAASADPQWQIRPS